MRLSHVRNQHSNQRCLTLSIEEYLQIYMSSFPFFVSSVHTSSKSRDIMSSIGLSSNVKIILCQFRMLRKKCLKRKLSDEDSIYSILKFLCNSLYFLINAILTYCRKKCLCTSYTMYKSLRKNCNPKKLETNKFVRNEYSSNARFRIISFCQ